ncbi:NF-kappa-B inhibitor-like protein 1 [Mercenaria mercenaria]|uniref:NF-kappa-B inhibitor-like protein 1 n=1 Tax=Mercenaria mercenaria TaxID=6596 RepID=UPI00234E8306|nr:NF-kappa-B inhibitor-like protein 1 [Mercenaria mercenaria]
MKGGDVSHWITNLKIVQDIFRFFGISAKKPKSNTSGNSAKRTRSQPYENLRGKMLNTCIINRKEYDKNFDLAKQLANEGAILTYDDIPWPNKNGRDGDCDILFEGMDITSTEYKERVRKERFRWHPDKFAHKFGNSLKPEDEYAIMTRVKDISQNINELIEMDKDMSYD